MALIAWCAALSATTVVGFAPAGPKVIGLGPGRTGTQTLKMALEILGHNVFGDSDIVWNAHVRSAWKEQQAGDGTRLRELLVKGNYTATTGLDDTVTWVWATFGNANDTKAILTVRDPEGWHRSVWYHNFYESRWMAEKNRDDNWHGYCGQDFPRSHVAALLEPFKFKLHCSFCVFWLFPAQKRACMQGHVKRNEWLAGMVPKEKLLIYNVREGWEPLCKFLGVPVPFQPFPRNDLAIPAYEDFWRWKCKFWAKVVLEVALHLGLLCSPCYCCWRRGRRRGHHDKDKKQ